LIDKNKLRTLKLFILGTLGYIKTGPDYIFQMHAMNRQDFDAKNWTSQKSHAFIKQDQFVL